MITKTTKFTRQVIICIDARCRVDTELESKLCTIYNFLMTTLNFTAFLKLRDPSAKDANAISALF